MSNEYLKGSIGAPPSFAARSSFPSASVEGVIEGADKFVTGDIGAWDYTYQPPAAQGFFGSYVDRRAWKNVNFQAGLTGRHTEAQNWNRVLSGLPEAVGDRSLKGRAATGAGAVIPFWENATTGFNPDGYIGIKDEDFDSSVELERLPEFIRETGLKYDPDFERKLGAAINKRAFDLTVNRAMKSTQLLEQITADDKAGPLGGWGTSVASALGNYVLFDEDTTRTFGFAAITRSAAGLFRGTEWLSKQAVKATIGGSYRTRYASDVVMPANPMMAVHSYLATKMGVARAAALEGAAMGAAWDIGFQADAIAQAEIMYGDQQNMVVYHPSHTLMAGGIGAGFGWAIPSLIQKLSKRSKDIADLPDDIAALVENGTLTFEGLARQHSDDAAMDSINNRIAGLAVTGSDDVPAVGWALSRELLDANGRTVDELETFVRYLEHAADAGAEIDSGVLQGALEQFMVNGVGASKTSTKARRKAAAEAKRRAAEAVKNAGGDLEVALQAVKDRRQDRRLVQQTITDMGVDGRQVSMVNGMPVLNVSHSGNAPTPGAIWPGSHWGSRDASAHFAGSGLQSHTGPVRFNRAVMMSDTQGQHDPKALVQEILGASRALGTSSIPASTRQRLVDFHESIPKFTRGTEAEPYYRQLGEILMEEMGVDAIIYRNAVEDAGSISIITFNSQTATPEVTTMAGNMFKAWARASQQYEGQAPRIKMSQWKEFLSGLGEDEQALWMNAVETIKRHNADYTDDEAASAAAFLFGLRKGMIDELDDVQIRDGEINTNNLLQAFEDIRRPFADVSFESPIHRYNDDMFQTNADLVHADMFRKADSPDIRTDQDPLFLTSIRVPTMAEQPLVNDGLWPMVRALDAMAEGSAVANSYIPSELEMVSLRLLEILTQNEMVPRGVVANFETGIQYALQRMARANQEVPTEVILRMALDYMLGADRALLMQGAADFMAAATQNSKGALFRLQQALDKHVSALDRKLGRVNDADDIAGIAARPKPSNRPAPDILTPAERQARADEVNRLMRMASDPNLSESARRDAKWKALKLSDDSGLTDNAFYAGSPVFTSEIEKATSVSGRNLAELVDSATQLSLIEFQRKFLSKEQFGTDAEAMHALARVWWEARNKRSELHGFALGSKPPDELPPVRWREEYDNLDQERLEVETLYQLFTRKVHDVYDELVALDPTSAEYQILEAEYRSLRQEWDRLADEMSRNAHWREERAADILDWIYHNGEEAHARWMTKNPAKTYASERARVLIQRFADDPVAFRNISEQHRRLGLALEAGVRSGRVSEDVAKITRAIWSQSDLKFLEMAEIRFTKHDTILVGETGERIAASGMVERLIPNGTRGKFRVTPVSQSQDFGTGVETRLHEVVTIGHELLHVALFATPGLRKRWVRMHQELISTPRKLGRALAALREVMPNQSDEYYNYFLHDADEFFVEFGARYLTDSKFREVMLDATEPKGLEKIANLLFEAAGAIFPYVKTLDIGLGKKKMEMFFSMVDQAAGFKPVARAKYLVGEEGDKMTGLLHRVWGPKADRLGPNAATATPFAELLQKIYEASARGDTAEVAKLNRQLKKVYGRKVTTSGQVLGKHVSRMSAAERAAAVNVAFDNLSESQADVVAGTNRLSRAFQVAGLGKMLNRIITNRQGLGHTMFSDFKELRAVTALFDVGRWGMQKIGVVGPMNLQGAKNWAIRQFEPVGRNLEELRHKAGSRKSFEQAQAEMVRLMAKGEAVPANHKLAKEMKAVMDSWKTYMGLMKERGMSNGVIRDLSDDAMFMPLRLDPSKVRGREPELIQKLTQHWLKQFSTDAPETALSTQTMRDTLGWYAQKLDKDGRPAGKAQINTAVFPDGKLPKTLGDLTDAQKQQYLAALSQPVPHLDGKTAIEHAAQNYMRRQLGEEGFTGGVREFNKRRDTGRSAASHKTPNSRARRFTQQEVFIDTPELGEFFVTDLYELGHNYASSTGFRIAAQDVLDDFLGFRGLGWHEFLVTMEQRTLDKLGIDDQSIAAIRGGYEKLHEVFADLAGGLPHMDSGYNTVNKFGADAGRQAALMLYGSGIGTTIVGVENMWSLFSKVHSPMDLIDNIGMLLKGWAQVIGKSDAVREELAGTVMGVKRMQQHTANRFVTGSAESPGALHWADRLVGPWKQALDTLTGKITPGGDTSRAAATTIRTMEAMGQTAQQLGLNRIFNETGWVIQSNATKRELRRYWDRARVLAQDLADNPILAQDSEAASREFKTRARKAGFGDRWDIARRFDEGNLLDVNVLDRLGDTGGKSFAFDKMQQHGLTLAGQARDDYMKALDALTFTVENEVMKRISEAQSLYKVTDVSSRTFTGQLLNSMFSFSRSFYTNQVLDAAGMPSRGFLGMLSSYMFWEIFTSQARAVLDGQDPEVVMEQWKNDPVGMLMSNGARVPLLGAYSAIPKYGIDTARKAAGNDDVRVFDYSPHQSAGTGAFEKLVQAGADMFSAPVKYATGEQDGPEIAEDLWKHHGSIIPGVNAFYTETLRTLFDPTYGED